MTRNQILDIENQEVRLDVLKHLVNNIKNTSNEDKVGVYFKEICEALEIGFCDYELASVFLDDLDLRPVTAQNCGYVERKPLDFDGFMYSEITDICFKMHNKQLYRLPLYKRNENASQKTKDGVTTYINQDIEWDVSEFSNINGTASEWIPVTPLQMKTYDIQNKWNLFIKKLNQAKENNIVE